MSFFDDASLVFLPSGQAGKDGKAYSMKPTNGDGDFTFSRGSNLTATRVDSNGLIEKGRENLLLQSNQFDTTWANSGTNETSGQSGYDGSSDAWLLTKNVSDAYIYQNISQSGVQCVSVYAKANAIGGIQIYVNAGTTREQSFNLTNGTLIGSGNNIDAKIESVGNGWYRCSMALSDAITRVRFYPMTSAGDKSGTSGSIYIQDAQLEQGLVATEYIESGATTGLAGILEDSPRFDYSGGASCPSLLLEPSRTNLISQSEYFTALNSGSVVVNDSLSPEGLQNANKIIFGASVNDGATMNLSASCSGNTQYTWSAYVKNISGTGVFNLRIDTDTTTILVNQDITATSEWTRVSHTFTTDASATSFGSNSRYRSKADGNEILIWGAQLEEGSYPTSYIPNHSGGSVTREAEGQTYSGFSSLIGQTEGTLFLEIDSSSNNTEIFSLNRSTANAIFLRAVSNVYGVYIYADGATYIVNTSININDKIKIAIAYESRNFAIYANGSQVSTNNSNWTPNISIDSLNFNVGGYISSKGKVNFNKVLLFKERISNGNLATLTS